MPQPTDLKTRMSNFRTKLRERAKPGSVVSIALDSNESTKGTDQRILVLYNPADPSILETVKAVERETAPGVRVETQPSEPARPH